MNAISTNVGSIMYLRRDALVWDTDVIGGRPTHVGVWRNELDQEMSRPVF